ncbi:heme oxygenase [Saccharomonospora amisosensis]|uniref:Heme oxygenase n=1 Tax=Saccharomonospora amisosensis TaxID=1128677 RepID=A0A7X5ZPC4_9PSEU|nr:biliverdin-producing heme oxygenase [Saccharomonospora amisosensis]NIJ10331.1 heme oxygenase [Saccharomonospora amisosensis]
MTVPESFSQQLRESTRQVHERAHHSTFMTALLDGRLPLRSYTRLAEQYYFIYRTLEQASEAMACDAVGAPFVLDELYRLPALSEDLEFLAGPEWRHTASPLPATEKYVRRMREVAFEWPGGYVAHHYTRYLGDLAGGQVVGSLLRRRYGISGAGARFYDFSRVGNPHAFRKRYRHLLDNAGWDAGERRRIVDETLLAFELNISVLTELAAATAAHSAA